MCSSLQRFFNDALGTLRQKAQPAILLTRFPRHFTNLSTDGAVVSIHKLSARISLLPRRRRHVGEGLAEYRTESDVIAASAPLEFARWRFVWQPPTAALGRYADATRLGDGLGNGGRG